MVSTEQLASDHAQQLVTDWIARMKAPPPDPTSQSGDDTDHPLQELDAEPFGDQPMTSQGSLDEEAADLAGLEDEDLAVIAGSWWKRVAVVGTILGAAIGFTVFWAQGAASPVAAESMVRAEASPEPEPDLAAIAPVEPDATPVEPEAVEPTATPARSDADVGAPRVEEEAAQGSRRTRAKTAAAQAGRLQALASRPLSDQRPRAMANQFRRLLRRGWRAYDRGDFQTATNAFARAVHSWPDKTGGYFGMALSLFEQGAEDGAMQVLERGVKKVGPKAGLWVLAGSIYQFKGKDRLARMAYQRYLRNNPRGRYARDVRVILAYDHLPRLHPFEADAEEANPSVDQ